MGKNHFNRQWSRRFAVTFPPDHFNPSPFHKKLIEKALIIKSGDGSEMVIFPHDQNSGEFDEHMTLFVLPSTNEENFFAELTRFCTDLSLIVTDQSVLEI